MGDTLCDFMNRIEPLTFVSFDIQQIQRKAAPLAKDQNRDLDATLKPPNLISSHHITSHQNPNLKLSVCLWEGPGMGINRNWQRDSFQYGGN